MLNGSIISSKHRFFSTTYILWRITRLGDRTHWTIFSTHDSTPKFAPISLSNHMNNEIVKIETPLSQREMPAVPSCTIYEITNKIIIGGLSYMMGVSIGFILITLWRWSVQTYENFLEKNGSQQGLLHASTYHESCLCQDPRWGTGLGLKVKTSLLRIKKMWPDAYNLGEWCRYVCFMDYRYVQLICVFIRSTKWIWSELFGRCSFLVFT